MALSKDELVIVDPEQDLQALFDNVLKPDARRNVQVPWNKRKLPDSFFKPPTTGSKSISHSRDSSVDSSFGSNTSTTSVSSSPIGYFHHRAHSSPASFQDTYLEQQLVQHFKQKSHDVNNKVKVKTRLPYGWEESRTRDGKIYYINHNTQTTSWEHPFEAIAAQDTAKTPHSTEQLSTRQHLDSDLFNLNPLVQNVALKPLPDGWEQAQTSEGETYFINHHTRSTSWMDPRISLSQDASARNETLFSSHQLRLQELQIERERLKQRHQEILRLQKNTMTGSTSWSDPTTATHLQQSPSDKNSNDFSSRLFSDEQELQMKSDRHTQTHQKIFEPQESVMTSLINSFMFDIRDNREHIKDDIREANSSISQDNEHFLPRMNDDHELQNIPMDEEDVRSADDLEPTFCPTEEFSMADTSDTRLYYWS